MFKLYNAYKKCWPTAIAAIKATGVEMTPTDQRKFAFYGLRKMIEEGFGTFDTWPCLLQVESVVLYFLISEGKDPITTLDGFVSIIEDIFKQPTETTEEVNQLEKEAKAV